MQPAGPVTLADDNRDIHCRALSKPRRIHCRLKEQHVSALCRLNDPVADGTTGGVKITRRRDEPWISMPHAKRACVSSPPSAGLALRLVVDWC